MINTNDYTGQNPMQCCPRGSRQHCKRKILRDFVLILLGQHCTEKTLCSVDREALDNIAEEKFLFNVVLILSEQKYACQNPMQCCPRGSRQHCIRKNPVQCCLNTLGTILHRSKPYVMLPKRLTKTLHKKKAGSMLS